LSEYSDDPNLQKRPSSISIRAGSLAKQLIEKEGFYANQVDIIPGAAGGPKGIGLTESIKLFLVSFSSSKTTPFLNWLICWCMALCRNCGTR
jgi:hypothetical protein